MPFASPAKRRKYAKKWRFEHPFYMRKYGRQYYKAYTKKGIRKKLTLEAEFS